ncbi:MAG TPA: site-specific integrase [Candidatus Binatia bacterium]|nr:site-specific integrase [Candidatus Binatia bacterium]
MDDERADWIISFASGRTWQNKLASKLTKAKFTAYFKKYCDAVQKDPDQLIAFKVEGLQNVGTEKEFQAENLLEDFFAKSTMKPTAKLMLKNAVFSFYKHNRRALEPSTASNVKDETPESKKRKPTIEDILTLENVAHSARDKALLWFIASTSCRVGTIVQLKWNDLKPTGNDKVPYMLEIESARLKGAGVGKYKGLKQITFLHKMAYEKLIAYREEAQLEKMDKKGSILKKGYPLNPDSPLFIAYWNKGVTQAIAIKAINGFFDDLSLRAWGDLEKKRFSPHDFREFFQSALENANVPANMISPIMAHKVKGVDQSYSSHDFKELLIKYETALPYLIPKSVSVLQSELVQQETKYKTQQQQIDELQNLVKKYFHDEDILRNDTSTKHGKEYFKEFAEAHKEQPKILKELKEKTQKGTE